jgi:hypothetical protein
MLLFPREVYVRLAHNREDIPVEDANEALLHKFVNGEGMPEQQAALSVLLMQELHMLSLRVVAAEREVKRMAVMLDNVVRICENACSQPRSTV